MPSRPAFPRCKKAPTKQDFRALASRAVVRPAFRPPLLAALLFGVFVVLPMASQGAADPGALRDRAGEARAKERSLEASLARLGATDARLSRQIAALQRRQAAIQADLVRDEAQLARTREELRKERARAARLAARLTEARPAAHPDDRALQGL